MKLPFISFYVGDWMKDPAVRSVSLAARGLWIDMLCLMHESDRRGFLQHATGKPVTAEQLARMVGCFPDEVSRLLQELETSGVFSCERGVMFSRRMVRDEEKRLKCSAAGRKGGGNPTFKGSPKGATKGEYKGAHKPPDGAPEDEIEIESDSDFSLSPEKSARKTKPESLADVEARAVEIELPQSEAVKFFDYYTSNGWRVGRNPMKDWRAALSNWKRNHDNGTYSNGSANRGTRQATAGGAGTAGCGGAKAPRGQFAEDLKL